MTDLENASVQHSLERKERLARHFESIILQHEKSRAMEFYMALDSETKLYIQTTKYKWALKSAKARF